MNAIAGAQTCARVQDVWTCVCASGARFQRMVGCIKAVHNSMEHESSKSGIVNLEQTSGFYRGVSDCVCPADKVFIYRMTVQKQDAGLNAGDGDLPSHMSMLRIVLPLEHFAILSFPMQKYGSPTRAK